MRAYAHYRDDVSPYAALQDRVRRSPSAPLLTFYDLATGERMELSALSLDNAIAKTAGLLRDELDVMPGDRVGVHLPLHWQRAVWWGACAAVGADFLADASPADVDISVLDREHLGLAGISREDVLVSLEPFGLPSREPAPPGVTDHALAARAHPDVFVPFIEPAGDQMRAAQELAEDLGLTHGQRIVVAAGASDLLLLAVPLAIDGSAVLVRHADAGDLEAVLRAEGAR